MSCMGNWFSVVHHMMRGRFKKKTLSHQEAALRRSEAVASYKVLLCQFCHIISMEASVLDHALRALSELEVLVFCLLLP